MKYEICSANGYDALNEVERQVNNGIKKGWRPFGGIVMAYSERTGFYAAQAMVFEEAKEQSK